MTAVRIAATSTHGVDDIEYEACHGQCCGVLRIIFKNLRLGDVMKHWFWAWNLEITCRIGYWFGGISTWFLSKEDYLYNKCNDARVKKLIKGHKGHGE